MKHKPPTIPLGPLPKKRRSNTNDGLVVFDSDLKRYEKKQEKKRKIQRAKF